MTGDSFQRRVISAYDNGLNGQKERLISTQSSLNCLHLQHPLIATTLTGVMSKS